MQMLAAFSTSNQSLMSQYCHHSIVSHKPQDTNVVQLSSICQNRRLSKIRVTLLEPSRWEEMLVRDQVSKILPSIQTNLSQRPRIWDFIQISVQIATQSSQALWSQTWETVQEGSKRDYSDQKHQVYLVLIMIKWQECKTLQVEQVKRTSSLK